MRLNTLRKSLLTLSLFILVLTLSACSSLTGLEKKADNITESASGYYLGHYGASGWDDSINEKSYSNNSSVFTGTITKNQTK